MQFLFESEEITIWKSSNNIPTLMVIAPYNVVMKIQIFLMN